MKFILFKQNSVHFFYVTDSSKREAKFLNLAKTLKKLEKLAIIVSIHHFILVNIYNFEVYNLCKLKFDRVN